MIYGKNKQKKQVSAEKKKQLVETKDIFSKKYYINFGISKKSYIFVVRN